MTIKGWRALSFHWEGTAGKKVMRRIDIRENMGGSGSGDDAADGYHQKTNNHCGQSHDFGQPLWLIGLLFHCRHATLTPFRGCQSQLDCHCCASADSRPRSDERRNVVSCWEAI